MLKKEKMSVTNVYSGMMKRKGSGGQVRDKPGRVEQG